jgi:hypothetical protein
MQTVLVEINDKKVFHLLQELEGLNVLRIIKENITENKTKLSDKYRGAFTKEDAESFNLHTKTMRKEWDNI